MFTILRKSISKLFTGTYIYNALIPLLTLFVRSLDSTPFFFLALINYSTYFTFRKYSLYITIYKQVTITYATFCNPLIRFSVKLLPTVVNLSASRLLQNASSLRRWGESLRASGVLCLPTSSPRSQPQRTPIWLSRGLKIAKCDKMTDVYWVDYFSLYNKSKGESCWVASQEVWIIRMQAGT